MPQHYEIAKAVFEKEGKYLLLKRPQTGSYPDTWDFAGGKLDPGENPADAVKREAKEETAFDIKSGQKSKTIKYEDDEFSILFHYFFPEFPDTLPVLSKDHTEFRWVTREDMNDMKQHPSVIVFLQNRF